MIEMLSESACRQWCMQQPGGGPGGQTAPLSLHLTIWPALPVCAHCTYRYARVGCCSFVRSCTV